jgi:hypothetical protein
MISRQDILQPLISARDPSCHGHRQMPHYVAIARDLVVILCRRRLLQPFQGEGLVKRSKCERQNNKLWELWPNVFNYNSFSTVFNFLSYDVAM